MYFSLFLADEVKLTISEKVNMPRMVARDISKQKTSLSKMTWLFCVCASCGKCLFEWHKYRMLPTHPECYAVLLLNT